MSNTEIVPTEQNAQLTPVSDATNNFELMQRQARLLASGTIVPAQFRGNMSNCFIALDMALRLNQNPLMVMQGMYISEKTGTPAWYAKFLIATFNATGKYSSLTYNEVGERGKDTWGFYCTATELATGKEQRGVTVTIDMARKEGWFDRRGTKWISMPELMMRYRAAAFLIRQVAPEVTMGLLTREELEDVEAERRRSELIGKLKGKLEEGK